MPNQQGAPDANNSDDHVFVLPDEAPPYEVQLLNIGFREIGSKIDQLLAKWAAEDKPLSH